MATQLTHAFDDEGSQFDASGNCATVVPMPTARNRAARPMRGRPISGYPIIDDIKINGKLTNGEDLAICGTLLAYLREGRHKRQSWNPVVDARATLLRCL